jgi:hypothetical protein
MKEILENYAIRVTTVKELETVQDIFEKAGYAFKQHSSFPKSSLLNKLNTYVRFKFEDSKGKYYCIDNNVQNLMDTSYEYFIQNINLSYPFFISDIDTKDFVLPEKWCVKGHHKEVVEYSNKYGEMPIYVEDLGVYHHYPPYESMCTTSQIIKKGYTEITLEQFKKHVLKNTTSEPISEFKVGDVVRVITDKPIYGWGVIHKGDVGIITNIEHPVVIISFFECERWQGLLSEIELVTELNSNTDKVELIPGNWYIGKGFFEHEHVIFKYKSSSKSGTILLTESFTKDSSNVITYNWNKGIWSQDITDIKPFDITTISTLFPHDHELYTPLGKKVIIEDTSESCLHLENISGIPNGIKTETKTNLVETSKEINIPIISRKKSKFLTNK